jgi:hypothetical protein
MYFCPILLFLAASVSADRRHIENVLKGVTAPNQYPADQFDAHMQWIKDMKATFVTEEHHEQRRKFKEMFMQPQVDTRKKQEVAIDPKTGELYDVETGEIIPM